MPKLKPSSVPSYRKHRATGQAVVTLGGRDFYLGRYGSAASKAEYDRLIAEWLASGRHLLSSDGQRTINELILDYVRHAEKYYRRPDGTHTTELGCLKLALRSLRKLYGDSMADDFGPSQLRTVRDAMIGYGWVRRSINLHLSRLKHLFAWAGEHDLVRPEVYHGLLCVKGLRGGRSDAKESEPVKPVPQAFIDAALPHVLPPVEAMAQVQLLTGCRPGEVCIMRGIDLDMTGRVWVYRPESHKTQHHGHQREIFIGPKCQEVIKPFLKMDLNAFLFSPADAEQARIEALRRNRKSPRWPSHIKVQAKKRSRQPKRFKGDRYTTASYRRAIGRACQLADRQAHKQQADIPADQTIIPTWHPHQLRHNSATVLRKEFGLEMARIVLGHHSPFVTQIYAEKDREQAMNALAKIG